MNWLFCAVYGWKAPLIQPTPDLTEPRPQIRLLLVITLLRNNRQDRMQARELWLNGLVDIRHTQGLSLSLALFPCTKDPNFACDGPTTHPPAHMGFSNNAIPRCAGICIECHVDGSASTSSPSWVILHMGLVNRVHIRGWLVAVPWSGSRYTARTSL